jgi:hypothetical protein
MRHLPQQPQLFDLARCRQQGVLSWKMIARHHDPGAGVGPLLSVGHLPLQGKTPHWEYSGFEPLRVLLPNRIHARPGATARRASPQPTGR